MSKKIQYFGDFNVHMVNIFPKSEKGRRPGFRAAADKQIMVTYFFVLGVDLTTIPVRANRAMALGRTIR